jgi:hypothetical protein
MDASFLECGRRRRRFTDALANDANVSGTSATHRANNRRSQQPLSSSRLVRPAKAAPEVAALQRPQPPRQPPPLNERNAFWSAALQAPLYGRPRNDANVSGTLGDAPSQRPSEPTTAVVEPTRAAAKRSPEVAALQRPQPPRQPLPLNGRDAFWSAAPQAPLYGRLRSDANVSGTLGMASRTRANNRCRRADSCGKRKRRLKSPHSKDRNRPASRCR